MALSQDDVSAIETIAKNACSIRIAAVLNTMVIIHANLIYDLIDKGILTPAEYAASMVSVQTKAAKFHKDEPELFSAVSQATMMLDELIGSREGKATS